MKATSPKRKIEKDSADQQLELIYREDRVNEYWDSRLFNRVYLTHDIKDKVAAWNDDQHFPSFQEKIKNILNAYKGKERALETMSERNLQNSIVKDILVALNWANDEEGPIKPFIDDVSFTLNEKTYKPDIIVLEHPDDNQKVEGAKAQDRLDYARRCAQMVVEVKYWNRIEKQFQREKEDKSLVNKDRQDDLSGIVTPNDQTIRYMALLKLNWGMLTDGTKWRLFNKDLSVEGSDRYYEFNFYKLFKAFNTAETKADHDAVDEGLKYFFHFFAKQSFFPEDGSEPLVDHVLKDSKKYADKIEEDLKSRFLEAMNVTCNAIHDSSEFRKIAKTESLNPEQANSLIVNTAESILFNIMFIKSLETRRVLPMASTDYKKLSLTSTLWKIEKYNPENSEARNAKELERMFSKGNGNSFAYTSDGFAIHERIARLINAIHMGSKKDDFGFEISGFKETIFSDLEWEVFNHCTIPNKDWVAVLFMLGYTQSETLGFRKYQQIPYEFFTPRQLGSIYETFLEYKLDRAPSDMAMIKNKWLPANLDSEKLKRMDVPKVKKGKMYFTPDNEERAATGSYYTPDSVVQLMLHETLGKIINKKSSAEILKITINDPAMGSGHFLSGALNYLTKHYLEALKGELLDDLKMTIPEAKQLILNNCIFGVDLNPRAVKLAKMSLWLESATYNKKLEHLDGHLKCGNSLVHFKWENEFKSVFREKEGFDLIIGNPPYLDSENMTRSGLEDVRNEISETYQLAQGNWDIYIPFFERGLNLLNENGMLAYITPDKWLSKPFGDQLRLQKGNHINKVIRAGREIFPNAKVDSIITIFTNKEKSEISGFDFNHDGTLSELNTVKFKSLKPPYRLDEIFSENQSILNKIDSFTSLFSQIGKCESACATSDAYKLKPLVEDLKKQNFDSSKYFKVVNTGTVDKFVSRWGETPMTYLKDKYAFPVLSKSKFKAEFPNSYGKKAEKPKIIIKGLTLLDACLDVQGEVVPGKSTLVVTSGDNDTLKLCSALLNSNLFIYYIKEKYKTSSYNGGIVFNKDMINNMPVPEIRLPIRKKLISIVDSALKLKFSNVDDRRAKIEPKLQELNDIVYNLYEVNRADIGKIEASFKSRKGESKKNKKVS